MSHASGDSVTTADWIIVVFALLLAFNGARQGFILGILQLVGFAAGAFIGARLGPVVLSGGAHSPYAPLFALGGAVVLGSLLGAALQFAGAAAKMAVRLPGLHTVDAGLGALLGAALALVVAWIVGAVLLQTPGINLRRDIQRAAILRALNNALPPSGFILNALARFDPLPKINGPSTEGVKPPTAAIARVPAVHDAEGSIVRVLGTACGLGVEGSGWVAGNGLVVTNAHVVAGESDTVVQLRGSGPRLDARAVVFSPTNDIAVLRVSGLSAPALTISPTAPSGRPVAIMGFPHNGPFDIRGARLGNTSEALSEDAYGRGPVRRSILAFRGLVRSGNSGGPLIDARGRVDGTVFAATVGGRRHSGYAVPNPIVRSALAAAGGGTVSTGPCAR
jgi:S1-C subfamily serine protease